MKNNSIITTVVVIAAILVAAGVFLNGHYHFLTGQSAAAGKKELYYCPMHQNFTSDKLGDCAICGMSLVKRESAGKSSDGEVSVQTGQGVYISSERQQLIGVKTGRVEKRKLFGQINTVGVVAYDPNLFVAQEEYLQTIKGGMGVFDSNSSYASERYDAFIKTSKRKLLLLGMSEDEIEKLAKAGKPEQSLYLPEGEMAWVYLSVYQYESEFIKVGLPVEIQTSAYPGQTFDGEIVSISPLLDVATRAFKVRAFVKNPANKLKLETFANAKIKYDLGEKLSVPIDAIMDAGLRKYVFMAEPNGYFEPRNVKTGLRAQGFYEVLEGLSEGDDVVTSANFLIDSESKLNAVLNRMGEPNQQTQQGTQ